jgi:hypothetical protein
LGYDDCYCYYKPMERRISLVNNNMGLRGWRTRLPRRRIFSSLCVSVSPLSLAGF